MVIAGGWGWANVEEGIKNTIKINLKKKKEKKYHTTETNKPKGLHRCFSLRMIGASLGILFWPGLFSLCGPLPHPISTSLFVFLLTPHCCHSLYPLPLLSFSLLSPTLLSTSLMCWPNRSFTWQPQRCFRNCMVHNVRNSALRLTVVYQVRRTGPGY